MNKKYIDKEEWIERLEKELSTCKNEKRKEYLRIWINAIKCQPTIALQEVKHGEWIFKYEGSYNSRRAYCSVCGKRSGIGGIKENQMKPYCPNCGAEMNVDVSEVVSDV